MRFASVGVNRAAKYTAAGRSVVNESAKAFDHVRSNSPNYTDLAVQGMKARSYEKRAAWDAEKDVAQAGVKAAAHVQGTAAKSDAWLATQKADFKTRMAGKVAAAGSGLRGGFGKRGGLEKPIEPVKGPAPTKPKLIAPDLSDLIEDVTPHTPTKVVPYVPPYKRIGGGASDGTPKASNVSSQSLTSSGTFTPDKDGFYNISIVDLGNRLKDNFGLTIVEHPAFGGNTGGHASNSHHKFNEAIDIQDWRDDDIDGVNWRTRTANLMDLLQGSAHETIGPNQDPKKHWSHGHVGAYGGNVRLNQNQFDILFGGNSGGLRATFAPLKTASS